MLRFRREGGLPVMAHLTAAWEDAHRRAGGRAEGAEEDASQEDDYPSEPHCPGSR